LKSLGDFKPSKLSQLNQPLNRSFFLKFGKNCTLDHKQFQESQNSGLLANLLLWCAQNCDCHLLRRSFPVPTPAADGSYAGEIMPKEAWGVLNDNPKAQIVDVRTSAEWSWVGVPDMAAIGKQLLLVEWLGFPGNERNIAFAPQLEAQMETLGLDKETPLLMLCRSGKRSLHAARLMTSLGYSQCYNITTGFEGDPDGAKHRGTVNGWKMDGLPWIQG